MRVLSISHRMQHPLIDNHSIFNAPAVFDYDAIVVDAGGVFDSIRAASRAEQEFHTFADLAVVGGESLDGAVGIAEVLRRRREEFVRALERGAVVAVFAHPYALFTGVPGFHGIDRYFWLPAPPGMAWDAVTVRGSEGVAVAIEEHGHPFVRIIDLLRQDVLYRAYLNDRAPGFASHAHVIARSAGGAPVGVEFRVLNGRVVFLPTPRESGASWLAAPEGQAMVEVMREMHRRPDADRPRWVIDTAVPGLDALEVAADRARLARERAEGEEAAALEAAGERAGLRDVLWEGAEYRLMPAVLRCAELLGFEHEQTAEDEPILTSPEGQLHVVAAGAEDAVDMAAHYRLRRRLDEIYRLRAQAARGLVVANGRRLDPPAERTREIDESLRVAAEATGYALVTSRWLFVAAVAALEGLAEETLAAIRRRLLETNGLVALHDLLVPADEGAPPDAEDGAEAGAGVATERS
ncbi:MAG: hypothetical protein FJZ92_12820 [Chloroflexi bacterium]|nr:hypothetical protein [Chloroflexota bacterium]